MKRMEVPQEIRELKLRAQDISAKRNSDGVSLIKAIVSPRTQLLRDKKRSPEKRKLVEDVIRSSYIKEVTEDSISTWEPDLRTLLSDTREPTTRLQSSLK